MKNPDSFIPKHNPKHHLERNLERLLQRAYVPVLPKPAFRDALATTFASEARRLGRPHVKRGSTLRHAAIRRHSVIRTMTAVAAALLGLLSVWWIFGQGQELSPPHDFLARGEVAIHADHGPWRPASEMERVHGIDFRSAHLRLLTPERMSGPQNPQDNTNARILAGEWTIEVSLASEFELQRTRAGLRVRLVRGVARAIPAAGAHVPLEAGDARLLPPTSIALAVEGAPPGAAPEASTLAVREPLPEGAHARSAEDTQGGEPEAESGLSGRVIDAETEAPITKFTVALLEPTKHQRFYEPTTQDFESEDGTFRVSEPPAAERLVFVYAAGYAMASLGSIDLRTPPELEVRLERGSTIRGRVIDAKTQLPVAGALVLSEKDAPTESLPFHGAGELGGLPLWLPISARTQPDGTFQLENCSSGTHRIRGSRRDYSVVWEDGVRVRGRGSFDVGDLQLERGGSLVGKVTLEDGSAWKGAQIVCVTMNEGAHMMHFGLATTDAEGRYEIPNLPPVVLLAILMRGNDTPWVRPVNISSGKQATVDFLGAREGARVSGTLFDTQGRPVPDQSLGIFDAQELNEGFSDQWVATSTDRSGRYTLESVDPGHYVIYLVDDSGMGLRLVDRLEVRDETDLAHDIHMKRGSIHGVVRDADLDEAVAGAMLLLERSDDEQHDFAGYQTTRADGSYRFEGLSDGIYTITAVPPDRSPYLLGHQRSESLILDEFQPKGEQDFALGEGCEVRLRVLDTDGNPLAHADVHLIDGDGNEISFTRIPLSDEDGRYHVRGARPGSYRASARSKGYRVSKAPSFECKVGMPVEAEIVLAPLPAEARRKNP